MIIEGQSAGDPIIEFLRERAPRDPIAHACLQMIAHGAQRDEVILMALKAYAAAADEAREYMRQYLERHCVPMTMIVERGES